MLQGLSKMGVREMTYKMLFMACSVQHCERKAGASTSSITAPTSLADLMQGSDDNDVDALNLSEAERNEILAMRNTDNKYQKFVDSMCPTICGHQEVKRGLLLQLFGGAPLVHSHSTLLSMLTRTIFYCISLMLVILNVVCVEGVHKTTVEGISLRGDINVCIVGDPSCAKSQVPHSARKAPKPLVHVALLSMVVSQVRARLLASLGVHLRQILISGWSDG